jgi:hypothetical protein
MMYNIYIDIIYRSFRLLVHDVQGAYIYRVISRYIQYLLATIEAYTNLIQFFN